MKPQPVTRLHRVTLMPAGLDQQGRHLTRGEESCITPEVDEWLADLVDAIQFWALVTVGLIGWAAVLIFIAANTPGL